MRKRSLVAAALMCVAALASAVMHPKNLTGRALQKEALEGTVPASFGDWSVSAETGAAVVSPAVQASLDQLYAHTVTRTYVNSKGERIMLSLAYGQNQARALQVHKPEVCYVAQGFELVSKRAATVAGVPAMQLVARQGNRIEPVTYWIRIGNDVVSGWYEQNRARIAYGMRGEIPDGLLFRVSSISSDPASAFAIQQEFVRKLIDAVTPEARRQFLGDHARAART